MRVARILPLLAVAALAAACERSPGAVDEAALSVTQLQWTGPMPSPLLGGLTVALNLRATDAAGKPVPGVAVLFSAAEGQGSFQGENARVYTDTAGIARTAWTLGMAGGEEHATARVEGGKASLPLTFPVTPGNPNAPRFKSHAVSLAGPMCAAEAEMESGRGVFSIAGDGASVLQLATVAGRTGTYSGLYVGFLGRAPGTARIVAADPYGRTDTLTVTVGPSLPTVNLRDTLAVAVGDSAFTSPAIGGPCASTLNNSFIYLSFYTDTTRNRSVSLAPDVFSTSIRQPGPVTPPAIRIVGLKPGTGRIVSQFWGGVDTAVVVVR